MGKDETPQVVDEQVEGVEGEEVGGVRAFREITAATASVVVRDSTVPSCGEGLNLLQTVDWVW